MEAQYSDRTVGHCTGARRGVDPFTPCSDSYKGFTCVSLASPGLNGPYLVHFFLHNCPDPLGSPALLLFYAFPSSLMGAQFSALNFYTWGFFRAQESQVGEI